MIPAVPEARRAVRRRSGVAALVWLGCCLLLSGCGAASRAALANQELAQVYQQPAALAALRGREAALPRLWMESARLELADARSDSQAPGRALELIDQGLARHPSDPALLLAQVEMLALTGQPELALQAAERVLGAPHAAAIRDLVERSALSTRLQLELALGEFDRATATLDRLAGRRDADPFQIAGGASGLALVRAADGDEPAADALLDRALDQGAAIALGSLGFAAQQQPRLAAAAVGLRRRALERRPHLPDLVLAVAVDHLQADGLPVAQELLASLAQDDDLPERLIPEVLAQQARWMVRAGQVDAGLALLFAQLDQEPLDRPALAVLEETWRQHGQPDDASFAERLWRARRALPPGAHQDRAALDGLLDTLAPSGPPQPIDG